MGQAKTQQTKKMKYKKLGFGLLIEYPNSNYLIRANLLKYENIDNTYDVTLELKRSDTGYWDTLDEEHYTLVSPQINGYVYQFVVNKIEQGFFNYFIKRYEYERDTFDLGNSLREYTRDKSRQRGGVSQ